MLVLLLLSVGHVLTVIDFEKDIQATEDGKKEDWKAEDIEEDSKLRLPVGEWWEAERGLMNNREELIKQMTTYVNSES